MGFKPRPIKGPFIDLEETSPGVMEEVIPGQILPIIKKVSPDALPKNPIVAPSPKRLFRKVGQPRPLEEWSDEEVRTAIQEYFAECMYCVTDPDTGDEEYYYSRRPTVEGIAQALQYSDITAIRTYPEDAPHAHIIRHAVGFVLEGLADMCASDCRNAGAMFLLGQMGYLRKDPAYIPADTRGKQRQALTQDEIIAIADGDIVD